MAAPSRQQPPWQPPKASDDNSLPPLQIYNSLTRNKTPFIPIDPSGRTITWYACGPTVYDDAHLGHARTYLTSDIVRRIVRDYFGFNVRYVMNITDVDDKIILRARQQHLLHKFKQDHGNDLPIIQKALAVYIHKNLQQTFEDATPAAIHTIVSEKYADLLSRNTTDDNEAKQKMHVKTTIAAARALTAIEFKTDVAVATKEDSKNLDDVLMPYIDAEQGSLVDAKDHSIFTRLTKRHEERFMEDMHALNIQDPDDITRVTEYIPQVVEFVSRIQENGFAYETSSGIYFDIDSFEKANNHYARLEPWNRNDTALQADGEGAISGKEMKKGDPEKRSQADFALWKHSKPGEPSWPSPWGDGRPGWHIECSAMASAALGKQMDIHSGGIDLAFPHHDNELAQSEAYWTDGKHEHQWVNYFMHMGHLSIAGAKMSKSLKNFTTIRDALSQGIWTSRGLRIVLLLGGWKDGIEITNDVVKASIAWEDKLNNFFINAKDVAGDASLEQFEKLDLSHDANPTMLYPAHKPRDVTQVSQSSSSVPVHLDDALEKAKSNTYLALCDSFNTNSAMNSISELVTQYNSTDPEPPKTTTLNIARWITAMINMLGLNGDSKPTDETIGWSGLDIPSNARLGLTAISTLRDEIRSKARSPSGLTATDIEQAITSSKDKISTADPSLPFLDLLTSFQSSLSRLPNDNSNQKNALGKPALALCDCIRDEDLWSRGIYLEDRDLDRPALIRIVTKELRSQRDAKDAKDAQKAIVKAERQKEAETRAEKGRSSQLDMFKTNEYTKWDEEGLPTHDREGKDVAKSKIKKLRKEWERQKKLHEAWLAKEEGKEGNA